MEHGGGAKVNAEAAAEAGVDAEPSTDLRPPLPIHGLRHTYATAALYARVPDKVVPEPRAGEHPDNA